MSASRRAKSLGAASLEQVSKCSGYTTATLHSYYKKNVYRFDCLVMGTIAIDSGVSGEDIKNIAKIKGSGL
jgi:hypothetical protein